MPLTSLVDPSARYLVTGGAGFIGSHLVRQLVAAGAQVTVLDDLSTGKRQNLDPVMRQIRFLEGSVTEMDHCREAVTEVDYVLHQAAIPSVSRSVAEPLPTHAACASGTLNLLVAARDAGVKRFVCAGSSSAYGDTPSLPKEEGMPTSPRSPYAVAKLAGEHYARAFHASYGMETVTLRYFNVFGPRQDPDSPYTGVIALFISAALEQRSPEIHGDGRQTRDFTYVDNVVQANFRAAHAAPDKVAGRVFNVGCGDRISVRRLWEEIREITGCPADAIYTERRPGDVKDSQASLVRIQEAMGYAPTVPLTEGLSRTVAWVSEPS
ncbi:MAG: SDR family oxidoreductase [Gemmatimonadota bacterium]